MKQTILFMTLVIGMIATTFGQMVVNEKRMMMENETEFKNMCIFVEINNIDKSVNKDKLHEEHATAYFEFWLLIKSKVDEDLLKQIEFNNVTYYPSKDTYLTDWKNIIVEYNKEKKR